MMRSTAVRAGLATAAAGAIGLGLLAVPAGAGQSPSLPDVSAERLVASVLTAKPPALAGTVSVDNALGLPALPGMSDEHGPGESPLSEAATTARLWSDGQGRSRLALPSSGGEQTYVADGDTLWRYDSASRSATAIDYGEQPAADKPAVDPAAAAQAVVSKVRETSTVAVDGTARVAGRPAYELVLTPAPTERTLLREVRVAVDSATRLPLQLTVLANGSPEPALQAGFTDLEVAPQDAGLFTFTPPDGVTVQRPELPRHDGLSPPTSMVRTAGDGWDTVVLGRLPAAGGGPDDPLALARELGRPASGPWGSGWAIDTAVGTVLVASDGRVAAGAVPQQVLDEALAR